MLTAALDLFAAAPLGLETVVADELRELGGGDCRVVPGGVELRGGLRLVARINLWSRCASRLLLRIGSFKAAHLSELRRRTARLEWLGLLDRDRPVRVSATCRKSRIYHSGAAAERVYQGICDALGGEPREAGEGPDRLDIMVRVDRNRATVSVDSSGELLHRRGYRLRTAKAPLRENLAAAFLRIAGWPTQTALFDPMCGSGTFLIEAGMMAAGVAPGSLRAFACQSWPGMQDAWFQAGPAAASDATIAGADRDAGAVEAARENAARAGLRGVAIECRALSNNEACAQRGLLITNPPYGGRVGGGKDLRNLYAALGNVAGRAFPAWDVALVARDAKLVGHTGLSFRPATGPVEHGGARVRLFTTSRRGV
jgi:putative N6-adenine-specific DNA methylase